MTAIPLASKASHQGPHLPEILDTQQVAQLLRVHLTTIQELARRGALPGRKVGKDYRFVRDKILSWLETAPPASSRARGRR